MTPPQRITVRLTPDESLAPGEHIRALLPTGCDHYRVVRRSIDARHGRVAVQFTVEPLDTAPGPLLRAPVAGEPKGARGSVLIVGAGPAGLGAAFTLLERGIRPVVLDRGAPFPARHQEAKDLRLNGRLSKVAPPYTSGLGGAGAYSDGKLLTRRKGVAVKRAMGLMSWFAQDESLLVEAHPHVGSNKLPRIVESMRAFLEENGVSFRLSTEVSGLVVRQGRVVGVRVAGGEEIDAAAVVLATGNSSRSLMESLGRQGVAMEPKAFAVGLRIEHPRPLIDRIQYGQYAGHPSLGTARYSFAFSRMPRSVYTFCMCPGGHLLPTPPEEGHLAVNGMSHAARNSRFSNAAVVAAVTPDDFGSGDSPLRGISFQRRIEAACFEQGGGGYRAPAQRLTDFMAGRTGNLPECSYRPGVEPANLATVLPRYVVDALREGLRRAGQGLRGYVTEEAILVGAETLTSSPVRLPRNSSNESLSHAGLYLCGEGSGWAGGITSSFADGLETGSAVLRIG